MIIDADIMAASGGRMDWAWHQQRARNRGEPCEEEIAKTRARHEQEMAANALRLAERDGARLARFGLPGDTDWDVLRKLEKEEERDQALRMGREPFIKWWVSQRDSRGFSRDARASASQMWHAYTRDKRRAELVMRRGVCSHCKQIMPPPKKSKRKR